jgi:hypothetical protein
VGTTVTTTLDSSQVYAVINNALNTSYPKHVTVKAVSNGLVRTDTVMIDAPNKVYAYFEKDTLKAGDTVNIIIKKINRYGWESNYDPGTSFDISISNGCTLGLIMDSNGNTADHFTNTIGPFRFVVSSSITAQSDSVVLTVGAPYVTEGMASLIAKTPGSGLKQVTGNNSANNIKQSVAVLSKKKSVKSTASSCSNFTSQFTNTSNALAVVAKQEQIKIILTGPGEVWPYLPPQGDGKSRGADLLGYNPLTSIKIKATKSMQSLVNKKVAVIIERVEGTGGHDHTNKLDAVKCGKLNNYNNPHIFSTDENGEIIIQRLLSSQVSGNYTVKAIMEANQNIKDSVSFSVKVPGLIDFNTILSNEWFLTGSRTEHTVNHFCNPDMGINLSGAIMDFYAWNKTYSKKKNKAIIKLGINDMSLVGGGDFDIYGDWNLNSNHSFHRVGLSVDINRSSMNTEELSKLTTIIETYVGEKYPEKTIHFGFLGGH